jgi:hypothetical protein
VGPSLVLPAAVSSFLGSGFSRFPARGNPMAAGRLSPGDAAVILMI